MLSREWMGILALGIFWVNTLLVAGAALIRARELGFVARKFLRLPADGKNGERAHGSLRVRLRPGSSASMVVEQVGRYASGNPQRILWHDKAYLSDMRAAELVGEEGEKVVLHPDAAVKIWAAPDRVAEAAVCPSTAEFDVAFAQARKAKGTLRRIEVRLDDHAELILAGDFERTEDGWLVRGIEDDVVFLSAIDPIGWCKSRRLGLTLVFCPAVILLAAAITAVALTPPLFGTVSTVGGALALLYFLLVLPAGTGARDWARTPHERIVRGVWVDPAKETRQKALRPVA